MLCTLSIQKKCGKGGLANSWFSFVQISQMFFFPTTLFAIWFSLEVHLLKKMKETLKINKTISLFSFFSFFLFFSPLSLSLPLVSFIMMKIQVSHIPCSLIKIQSSYAMFSGSPHSYRYIPISFSCTELDVVVKCTLSKTLIQFYNMAYATSSSFFPSFFFPLPMPK